MNKVFLVSDEDGRNSEPLNSMAEAEKWVFDNLPYGVQKCRTGSYIILEGTICKDCGEFVEDKTGCDNCYMKTPQKENL